MYLTILEIYLLKNSIAVLRFGEVGDIITAISHCSILNADLIVCQSKVMLSGYRFTSKRYSHLVKSLSKITKNQITILTSLKQLRHYKVIYFFPQKTSIFSNLYLKFLKFILPTADVRTIDEGANYFYPAVEEQNKRVYKLIGEICLEKKQLSVAICWCGKEKQKNISSENIEKMCNYLIKKKYKLYILGDKELDINMDNVSVVNESGKTTLEEACEIIDNVDVVISVDTGLLHYAVLMGKPTLAVTAHRYDLALWFPFSTNTALLSQTFLSCKKKSCKHCEFSQCVNGSQVVHNLQKYL